jgi:hypothetical protein
LMMGAWRPKHVEKVCSNKICILLHHVGVLLNHIVIASNHSGATQTTGDSGWLSPYSLAGWSALLSLVFCKFPVDASRFLVGHCTQLHPPPHPGYWSVSYLTENSTSHYQRPYNYIYVGKQLWSPFILNKMAWKVTYVLWTKIQQHLNVQASDRHNNNNNNNNNCGLRVKYWYWLTVRCSQTLWCLPCIHFSGNNSSMAEEERLWTVPTGQRQSDPHIIS